MSAQQKRTLGGIGASVALAVGLIALADNVWARSADMQVLQQRVTRMEADRAQDAVELRAIRILVTRLCAVTPGCVEH